MRTSRHSIFFLLIVALAFVVVGQRGGSAQDLRVPEPQDVEFEGVITGFDVRAREVAIRAEQGVFVAALDPVRRARDGRIVGGIQPVRITIRAVDTTRVLSNNMLVRMSVKLRDRSEVVEPAREIEVVRNLPANGFIETDNAEGEAMIPRVGADDRRGDGLPPMIGNRPDERLADEVGEDGVETLFVAGRITSVRAGRVTIAVPVDGATQRVIIPTDDETFVRMVVDDLRRASIGDAVLARGVSVEPNRFFATELSITHVDERLKKRGWTEPRDSDPSVAEEDGEGTVREAERVVERDRPVDPFEIVKREREGKGEAKESAPASSKPASKAIYHGKTVRIN